MKIGRVAGFVAILAGLVAASTAVAGTITVVNFETVPSLAQGPSLFGGAEQNIVVPGVATFSGGTILGDAANFPAIVYATPPNVYGTVNGVSGYSETLTITVNPSDTVTEVSFPIFNGETFVQSYTATAFNGVTQVAQQVFSNVPDNTTSGYALADLIASNITSVTITPNGAPASWDFLIDTVAFNESVESAVAPEPASFGLFGLGIAGLAIFARRHHCA
jgi:hypothetical protein